MARQIEIANDLRPQERDDVRTDGKLEAGKDFFRHRCATQHVAALQHQHFLAGASQIGGIGQAVVSSADYDNVVFV